MGEIRVLDSITHVRSHPRMYFPSGEPTPSLIATRLADDALVLGAKSVCIVRADEWWIISADHDWLMLPHIESIGDRFRNFTPFPESGANSCRSEIFVGAFATAAATWTPAEFTWILGAEPDDDCKRQTQALSPNAARSAAFRM
jgi:hypothetical protein